MDYNFNNNGTPYTGMTSGLEYAIARDVLDDDIPDRDRYVKLTEAEKDKLVAKAQDIKSEDEKNGIIRSVVENEIWPKADLDGIVGPDGILEDSGIV